MKNSFIECGGALNQATSPTPQASHTQPTRLTKQKPTNSKQIRGVPPRQGHQSHAPNTSPPRTAPPRRVNEANSTFGPANTPKHCTGDFTMGDRWNAPLARHPGAHHPGEVAEATRRSPRHTTYRRDPWPIPTWPSPHRGAPGRRTNEAGRDRHGPRHPGAHRVGVLTKQVGTGMALATPGRTGSAY